MNNYLKAKLVSWRKINVIAFTDIPRPNSVTVNLYKNGKLYKSDKVSRLNSINHLYFFDISLNEDYELGASYYLLVDSFPFCLIDVSEATDFSDFDERYYYHMKLYKDSDIKYMYKIDIEIMNNICFINTKGYFQNGNYESN